MKSAPSDGLGTPRQGMFTKSELMRLAFMSGLLLVVVVIFVTSITKRKQYQAEERSGMPQTATGFVEHIIVPEFDAASIADKVADASADERVLLESEPFDALFSFAREYGDNVFRGGGGLELDAQAYDALAAAPATHRAKPYRVRGTIEEASERPRLDGVTETRGWLTLEDGRHAAFAIEELPDSLIVGDFVRVEGFFLKQFRAELGGAWVEGPMIVGRTAAKAYPDPPAVFNEEDLSVALANVTDDSFDEMSKLDEAARKAQWLLLDRVRRSEVAQPDWANLVRFSDEDLQQMQAELDRGEPVTLPDHFDGKVIELTNLGLAALHKWPALLRGRPFVLPISLNKGSWTADPGENPARLHAITTGWIANMTWTTHTGLIQFVMPRAVEAVSQANFVTGRGYFLKKLAYEPKEGELALVPLFVMQSVEPFVPPTGGPVDDFMLIAVIVMVLLIGLFPILLVRDRRRSAALQRELVRRRQERRSRRQDSPAPVNPAG